LLPDYEPLEPAREPEPSAVYASEGTTTNKRCGKTWHNSQRQPLASEKRAKCRFGLAG
jgi:hypothetical protein